MTTKAEYLISVAQTCQDDKQLWLRYLRKEFNGDNCKITSDDLQEIIKSRKLQPWQEAIIKEACDPESETASYLISLNAPADPRMLREIIKRHSGASQNRQIK